MPAPNQLLVDLFVIFAVTKCFGEIFERFSLPAVLGEILAGTTLGPHALGLIHPSDTVYSLAQVSAIFLLFSAASHWALPFAEVAQSEHVASDVVARISGHSAALWVTLAMVVSALGTLIA